MSLHVHGALMCFWWSIAYKRNRSHLCKCEEGIMFSRVSKENILSKVAQKNSSYKTSAQFSSSRNKNDNTTQSVFLCRFAGWKPLKINLCKSTTTIATFSICSALFTDSCAKKKWKIKRKATIWQWPDCFPKDSVLIFALSLLYVLKNMVDWISSTPFCR